MPDLSDTALSKIIVVLTGLLTIAIAFLSSFMGSSVLVAGMSSIGTLAGPVFGAYLLCFTCPYLDNFTCILSYLLGNFCSIFAFAGIFINPKNKPTMPWEINAQISETCLCDKDFVEIDGFLSADGSSFATNSGSGTNATDPIPECLLAKPINDIFNQDVPYRGFFEWIWHISFQHLGLVGCWAVIIFGWLITIIRVYILKKKNVRADDRTLCWFLREKGEKYDIELK